MFVFSRDGPLNDFHDVVIAAAVEVPYQRRLPGGSAAALMAQAIGLARQQAGFSHQQIDGLGVSSFTLQPDHAIDLAWRSGLSPRWCMDDCHGGASGINLLLHAARAIQAGDASVIVLVSGDHFEAADFKRLVENYNVTTRDYLRPLNVGGPNALFAMLTQRQMDALNLHREDYAAICIAQRAWASVNPTAVYREPLTLEEYMRAPEVASPLCRFDCVPVVSGADALIIAHADLLPEHGRAVGIRALRSLYNFDHQNGDGLVTSLDEIRDNLWNDAGIGPAEIDLVSVYDDYPAMVLAQLIDLGFAAGDDPCDFIHRRIATHRLPVNTSGGQLSAGQAGAAAGMHGLVEAVVQLRGDAGTRQVKGAHFATVSGYGMVEYRYGMCANAVVLQSHSSRSLPSIKP